MIRREVARLDPRWLERNVNIQDLTPQFEKLFYTKKEEDLEKEIHKYLNGYYGRGNTSEIDSNVYYYFNGEVAVKNHGLQEITDFEQLVNKLI